MPDVLQINSNVLLSTAMERRVLRSLAQCQGSQGLSATGLTRSGKWYEAANSLVKKGLAEEARGITLDRAYRITEAGRRAVRAERGGADGDE